MLAVSSLEFAEPRGGMVLNLFQFPRSQTRLALMLQMRNRRMTGQSGVLRALLITRFALLVLIFTEIHWAFHLLEESRDTPTSSSTCVSFLLSQEWLGRVCSVMKRTVLRIVSQSRKTWSHRLWPQVRELPTGGWFSATPSDIIDAVIDLGIIEAGVGDL